MKQLSDEEWARLAPDYPYERPAQSFVYHDGQVLPAQAVPWSPEERVAVVAYGSNRAPSVLRRKYDGCSGVILPTLRARLKGFDVVYAAFLSTLGPVPATLLPQPGAVVEVAVQFLTPAQLRQMHESEGLGISYGFAPLAAEALTIEGLTISRCFFYYSLYGVLRNAGEPISLAEVPCQGRCWPALGQREVQALVQRRLGAGADLQEFLLETISSARLRRERIVQLSADALAYHPAAEDGCGGV